jgi:hypothetical protein
LEQKPDFEMGEYYGLEFGGKMFDNVKLESSLAKVLRELSPLVGV